MWVSKAISELKRTHTHTSSWQKISLPQSHRSNHDGSLTDSESPQSSSFAEAWWQTYQLILWSSRWGGRWHDNWSGRNLDDGQTENNSIWCSCCLSSLAYTSSRLFSEKVNYTKFFLTKCLILKKYTKMDSFKTEVLLVCGHLFCLINPVHLLHLSSHNPLQLTGSYTGSYISKNYVLFLFFCLTNIIHCILHYSFYW